MSFFSKLGKIAGKVVRTAAPLALGATIGPWGAALGKAVVDHVGGGRKKLTLGSALGSGAKGFALGKVGDMAGKAAEGMGGWGSAVHNPKAFGSAVKNSVLGQPGSSPTRMPGMSVPGIATPAGGTTAGVNIPAFSMGGSAPTGVRGMVSGAWGQLEPHQKFGMAMQGIGAVGNAVGSHQEGKRADQQFELDSRLAESRLTDEERRRKRADAMAEILNPMFGKYLAGIDTNQFQPTGG